MFDVLTDLENAIDKVAADESPLDVERMCRLADRIEFLRLRSIGGFARSCEWQADGFLSAASALRARCRMSRGHALRAVDLARKVEQLPEVADAFAVGGDLSVARGDDRRRVHTRARGDDARDRA